MFSFPDEIVSLLSIGLVQLLALVSPGPSFLITARTAVAQSRRDGTMVSLGLGAGTVVWATAALFRPNVLFAAVPVFFGSIFIAMLPAQPPLWLMVALVMIVSFNEAWWYSAVALFFGTGPVRSFSVSAKTSIDRITGLFLGALGLRLLWSARETA